MANLSDIFIPTLIVMKMTPRPMLEQISRFLKQIVTQCPICLQCVVIHLQRYLVLIIEDMPLSRKGGVLQIEQLMKRRITLENYEFQYKGMN